MKTQSKRSQAKGRRLSQYKETILWIGWPLSCDVFSAPKSELYGWNGQGFTAAGLAEARLDWAAHQKRLMRKWQTKIDSYNGANIGRFPWAEYQLQSAIPVPSDEEPTSGLVRPF
jgi:hypothetical protein